MCFSNTTNALAHGALSPLLHTHKYCKHHIKSASSSKPWGGRLPAEGWKLQSTDHGEGKTFIELWQSIFQTYSSDSPSDWKHGWVIKSSQEKSNVKNSCLNQWMFSNSCSRLRMQDNVRYHRCFHNPVACFWVSND